VSARRGREALQGPLEGVEVLLDPWFRHLPDLLGEADDRSPAILLILVAIDAERVEERGELRPAQPAFDEAS
jgi:hypothetical protein